MKRQKGKYMALGPEVHAAPLYAKIKHQIRQMIQSGELAPNAKVPSENLLVKQFDVSRMTVHRALRELKEEGAVVRISGVGTFVADAQPKGHLITINNIAREVRSRGHEYSAQVIQNCEEKASSDVAYQLGVDRSTEVFHSIIIHMESGVPIQLEDRYVLKSALPEYGAVDFHTTTPNEYLMAKAPLQNVEHRVKSIRPDKQAQKYLRIDHDEPCLLLVRRTWSGGRVVSYAQLTHPGSRFEFVDTFKP